ncbi:BlaI/MecI/CopY family transcriptional regulator [Paenibacillus radicis (ex Xue et al. 2023)]|uniref:BlaI/MecI/CopY family transcriptional regulator n=1 Tax=Paenibacillus radicis (ex Xue et al. 2023) TaxID=2972489 RepID=A0ABT1YPV4_9BACL|nr:BlaI/MecI/CopY family transcriptional regulator [Paenibacillus radicis (ex Xue et al. 2023)]MCR8635216.1 BlaI/MecI/CopY family transcriptional regulator [Paenibacillus radicis (ex Xue et al. 2023)]
MMKIKNYHFQEEGLQRFLGSLEVQIMEIMWSSGQLSIKQVHQIIDAGTPYSFNTIMTVMNRLFEKGLLEKQTSGKGRTKLTLFKAACTKEQFLAEQAKNVTQGLIKEFGDMMVTHIIDVMEEADPTLIQKLQQKLDEVNRRKKL